MLYHNLEHGYFVARFIRRDQPNIESFYLRSWKDRELNVPLRNHDASVIKRQLFLANESVANFEMMTIFREGFESFATSDEMTFVK